MREVGGPVPEDPGPGSGAGPGAAAALGPVVAPSRGDAVVRWASEVVGGPAGRRLAPATGFWRALPVLILLAVAVFGAGVVQKEHCRSEGWRSPDMYWHACYSDIPLLYGAGQLGADPRPGLVEAVSGGSLGPPLEAAVVWTASVFVDPTPASQAPRRFFDLSVVLLAGVLVGLVVVVVRAAGRRPWDAAHVALSPLLITVGLISYDLLAVALSAGALLVWARRRPVAAGVLLGLAAATRPMTAVIGLAVLVLAVRAGRWVAAFDAVGAALLTWLGVRALLFPGLSVIQLAVTVVVIGVVIASASWLRALPGTGLGGVAALAFVGTAYVLHLPWGGLGLTDAWRAWKEAGPLYGSVWMIPDLLGRSGRGSSSGWFREPLSASAASTAALLGMVVVVVLAAGLALGARRRPRVADLALLLMVGFLLTAKAVPVQASLLLLPLVALAGMRWRDHLLWATAEVAYFVGTWLYIAGFDAERGLPSVFYLALLLWRLSMIGWLGVQAFRQIRDPRRDPVRSPDDAGPAADDPLGGPVDGAPDALRLEVA
jgi:hypothetical protein